MTAKKLSAICFICFVLLNIVPALGQTTRGAGNVKTQTSESRTALVIGNGSYPDSPLKNPPNDATDMAAALKTLGFEVLSYTNLDQNAMKKAIREFGVKLRANGGVGLFYYAGHGVQVKGANYLIPVSATVNSEEEVEYESVEVGLVLAQMESAKNNLNIVILDACRNNPFARSFRSAEKGLASIDAPSGTLLAYSTAPGSVASDGTGRNGLYTQELLKNIQTEGLSIEDVFKQVRISVRGATGEKQTPWESSSLTGNFYFSGSDIAPSNSVPATNVPDTPTVAESQNDVGLIPFAKVMNLAFAKDYEGKSIKTKVQFIAAGQMENWVFGAIPQKVMKDKVAFRVSSSDQASNSEIPFGSVPPHVFIDKAKSDLVFELKKGDFLILTGSTVVGTYKLSGGQDYTQIIFIATSIERAFR